jgi:hypothetical protein
MTARRLTNFRLEDDLLEGMQAVKEREGLSLTVQVRIAVRDWLAKKGVLEKARRGPARRGRRGLPRAHKGVAE